MHILIQQLEARLPEKMIIPEPLKKLYQWIEDNQPYTDNKDSERTGFLYPEDKLEKSWTDDKRDGDTTIRFAVQSNEYLKYWFRKENDEICSRLLVFAQLGADGSDYALWIDDDGYTKIVHMGSRSLLCCIPAEDAVNFLRLLAIGYDEICWNENYAYPPNNENKDFIVNPNIEFQNWVKRTFDVRIPQTALEIIECPSEMGDKNTTDAFCNWCNVHVN